MDISFHDFVRNKGQKPEPKKAPVVEHRNNKMITHKAVKPRPVTERKQTDYAAEADIMIENLKQKIDAVFYRFGVSGLEKLDEAFCETLNEMINPAPKKTIVKESRRLPLRKPVRRPTEVVEEPAEQPVKVNKIENELEQSAQAFLSAAEQQANRSEETETVKSGKKRFGIKEAAEDAITDDDLALLGAALSQK